MSMLLHNSKHLSMISGSAASVKRPTWPGTDPAGRGGRQSRLSLIKAIDILLDKSVSSAERLYT